MTRQSNVTQRISNGMLTIARRSHAEDLTSSVFFRRPSTPKRKNTGSARRQVGPKINTPASFPAPLPEVINADIPHDRKMPRRQNSTGTVSLDSGSPAAAKAKTGHRKIIHSSRHRTGPGIPSLVISIKYRSAEASPSQQLSARQPKMPPARKHMERRSRIRFSVCLTSVFSFDP